METSDMACVVYKMKVSDKDTGGMYMLRYAYTLVHMYVHALH